LRIETRVQVERTMVEEGRAKGGVLRRRAPAYFSK
jgi:hypothetical protein